MVIKFETAKGKSYYLINFSTSKFSIPDKHGESLIKTRPKVLVKPKPDYTDYVLKRDSCPVLPVFMSLNLRALQI